MAWSPCLLWGELNDTWVVNIWRWRQRRRNIRAGKAACGDPWLRLIAGRRLVAGVRLIAGRNIGEWGFLEESIESCLCCFSPLLIEQLLVVGQISHHPTPRKWCPFVVRVHLLQVVQPLGHYPDEALQDLHRQLLRHWRRRMLLSLHLLQLMPLLLQLSSSSVDSSSPIDSSKKSMASSSSSSRPTFLANSRHLRRSTESLLVRLKPLKSTVNCEQSFFHAPWMQDSVTSFPTSQTCQRASQMVYDRQWRCITSFWIPRDSQELELPS